MSKIVLNDVTNLSSLSVINDNFDKIEQEFQNKAMYRDNPEGEPNTFEDDVDLNGHSIYNIEDLTVLGTFTVNGKNVEEVVDAAIEGVEQSATSAANSATAAAASAASSAGSATASANSAATSTTKANEASASATSSANSAAASLAYSVSGSSSAAASAASASAASASESNANMFAANAAASNASAAGSASAANTSATNSTNSAIASASSATASANSASASAASAAAADVSADEAAASAASVNDANLVHKAGTETITGVKTFTQPVYAPMIVTNSSLGFRNRIINGDMRIDQRNAGASVSTASGSSAYTLDRWTIEYGQTSKFTLQQNAGSVTPPVGFTNYLGVTSSSAYSVGSGDYFLLEQRVEGLNSADLAWGTASAATITGSFWVRSSLTGTFGGAIRNSAGTRSYPFSFTVSAANTWEQKTVVISGDTSGTWLTTNGIGLRLALSLGVGSTYTATAGAWATGNFLAPTGATSVVGTSGATFYITGVQLEAGTVASPFERRDYGRELMMCQRYYWANTSCIIDGYVRVSLDTSRFTQVFFPVPMRAAPSITQTWDGGSSSAVGGVTTYSYRASVVQGDTTTARVITSVTASSEL